MATILETTGWRSRRLLERTRRAICRRDARPTFGRGHEALTVAWAGVARTSPSSAPRRGAPSSPMNRTALIRRGPHVGRGRSRLVSGSSWSTLASIRAQRTAMALGAQCAWLDSRRILYPKPGRRRSNAMVQTQLTGARTGQGVCRRPSGDRAVWLDGERVRDVTGHPAFAGAVGSIAGGLRPPARAARHAVACPTRRPASWSTSSHLIPRSRDDLDRRHRGVRRIAEFSVGLLGRTPDYLNVTFAGFAGRADVWARDGNEEGAANLVAFQDELVRDPDLSTTHTIIHPTVDKGPATSRRRRRDRAAQGRRHRARHRRAWRPRPLDARAVRRRARRLPRPAAPRRTARATRSPSRSRWRRRGSGVVPRQLLGAGDRVFDHPFSTRFDEQDAFIVFDDVEVPRRPRLRRR